MKANTIEVVDSLSLLSLKVAANVFDLSSGLHHVSIRDQIVRAQLAVRDLTLGDSALHSLLIVGAGVAGIAAALEATQRGVSNVVVVETQPTPFGLLKGIKNRYIGPYMYEWPSPFSRNQSYSEHGRTPWSGLSAAQLKWNATKPVSADELATMLMDCLMDRLGPGPRVILPPTICVNANKAYITKFVRNFARRESARALSRLQSQIPVASLRFSISEAELWPYLISVRVGFSPQYVLLAAGMGEETTLLVKEDGSGKPYTRLDENNYKGLPFWSRDTLLNSGITDRSVGVFGGGDGALQDVLRALTRRTDPLEFIEFLEKGPKVKKALDRVTPDLLTIDRQSRQFATWTIKHAEFRAIDEVCQMIARKLARDRRVARRVSQGIPFGRGQVSLFVRGTHFDKAYLLNRFLVHLIYACQSAHAAMWSGRMKLSVHFEHQAVAYASLPTGIHAVTIKAGGTHASTFSQLCDVISVRYGIMPGSVPGAQMIQVSRKKSKQRTSLARVELPFVAERN